MKIIAAALFVALLLSPGVAMARDVEQPAMLTLSPRPDWYVTGDKMHGLLGYAVGTAGDVNGDGFDDVIIASPTQFKDGRVYVYFGSPAGLTKSSLLPRWTMERGILFGVAVGTAGDVNGDGFADVIIGGPYEDEDDAGRVYGYYGSAKGLRPSSTADWTAVNGADGSLFGSSVGTAGDVNGDGVDDVIVGAYFYDTDDPEAGQASAYLGSAAGLDANPIWVAYGTGRFAWFGYSVATAGDVNGDGYDDVIVGSPTAALGGVQKVYAYYGSAAGLSDSPDWIVTQDGDPSSTLGRSVATAGDVNGDGFADVILGDAGLNHGEGRAYVYYGSAAGLSSSADWTAVGDPGGGAQNLGQSVGTAGDVNGDGFSDVIVGASAYLPNGAGRAYLYYGSPAGLSVKPALRVENTQPAALGWSVGTAGDVNGDGLDEFIIGAPFFDVEFDEGLAVVYYGRRPRLH